MIIVFASLLEERRMLRSVCGNKEGKIMGIGRRHLVGGGLGIAAAIGASPAVRAQEPLEWSCRVLRSEGVNQLALPNLGMSHIKHLRPSDRQKSRLIHKFSALRCSRR
jgi:hypothetical protein